MAVDRILMIVSDTVRTVSDTIMRMRSTGICYLPDFLFE